MLAFVFAPIGRAARLGIISLSVLCAVAALTGCTSARSQDTTSSGGASQTTPAPNAAPTALDAIATGWVLPAIPAGWSALTKGVLVAKVSDYLAKPGIPELLSSSCAEVLAGIPIAANDASVDERIAQIAALTRDNDSYDQINVSARVFSTPASAQAWMTTMAAAANDCVASDLGAPAFSSTTDAEIVWSGGVKVTNGFLIRRGAAIFDVSAQRAHYGEEAMFESYVTAADAYPHSFPSS